MVLFFEGEKKMEDHPQVIFSGRRVIMPVKNDTRPFRISAEAFRPAHPIVSDANTFVIGACPAYLLCECG